MGLGVRLRTWGFIADASVRGCALRIQTILDEYTRECHLLRDDRALRAIFSINEDTMLDSKWLTSSRAFVQRA